MPQNPLLSQLEGLIDPSQTSWWPLAPGWWVLAMLLLLLLVAFSVWFANYKKRNAYRKEALKRLQHLKIQQQDTIANINALLKQTALTAYGRSAVSRLTGEPWLDFLLTKNTKHTVSETELNQLKTIVCEHLYSQKHAEPDGNLYRFAQHWIKQHQNEKKSHLKEAKHA